LRDLARQEFVTAFLNHSQEQLAMDLAGFGERTAKIAQTAHNW